MGREGPKWGQEDFFLANPDLANILGRTDFDFEKFYFLIFLGPKFLAWAHLGPAWAHPLGPGVGPPTWAQLGPTHVGPAWAHPLGPSVGPPTWAQTPAPPPAPPPDEFSDPNLTPLPTHPGMKYVARTLAAIYSRFPDSCMSRFPDLQIP